MENHASTGTYLQYEAMPGGRHASEIISMAAMERTLFGLLFSSFPSKRHGRKKKPYEQATSKNSD